MLHFTVSALTSCGKLWLNAPYLSAQRSGYCARERSVSYGQPAAHLSATQIRRAPELRGSKFEQSEQQKAWWAKIVTSAFSEGLMDQCERLVSAWAVGDLCEAVGGGGEQKIQSFSKLFSSYIHRTRSAVRVMTACRPFTLTICTSSFKLILPHM